jgi:DUF971 family protein
MQPVDIRMVEDKEVLITWDDNHRSLYRFDFLRLSCPCAGCTDEWSGKRLISPDKIAKDIKIQEYSPVGRYAYRFRWSDGHQTGIYSFDFLRKLCPCGVCSQSAAGKQESS